MNKYAVQLIGSLLGCMALALPAHSGNPVIKDRFTADPAVMVYDDKVWMYVGHDEAAEDGDFFVMNEWLIYSSSDMSNWDLEGSFPRSAFSWARRSTAWASQTIERDGKFYWYVTVLNDAPDNREQNGFAIGVAVSDHPAKGFKDALGGPLVRSDMTQAPEQMRGKETWDNLDPTVYIDDDGQAYLYWGNAHLYYAKLKDNMIELDGEIHQVFIQDMPGTYTEGPYLHKHKDTFYLTFAMDYPEKLAYATADSLTGPWTYGGLLLDLLHDSGTSHPAVVRFKDQWYLVYHTSALPTGGNYRRSVSIEKFEHNPDGSIDQLVATASGVTFNPYRVQVYGSDDQYLRHQEYQPGVSALDSPDNDDFKWHVVSGLADDGGNYVSFQAENMPGFYLRYSGTGEAELAKHDGSRTFMEQATFKRVRGLASRSWLSYQTYGDNRKYLTQQDDGSLGVGRVKRADRAHATFQLQEISQ